MTKPLKNDDDKPHRCPGCWAVTVDDGVRWWRHYQCCSCDATFTRFPFLGQYLIPRIHCSYHQSQE